MKFEPNDIVRLPEYSEKLRIDYIGKMPGWNPKMVPICGQLGKIAYKVGHGIYRVDGLFPFQNSEPWVWKTKHLKLIKRGIKYEN